MSGLAEGRASLIDLFVTLLSAESKKDRRCGGVCVFCSPAGPRWDTQPGWPRLSVSSGVWLSGSLFGVLHSRKVVN